VKAVADKASQIAAEKKDVAHRSKLVADNAVAAYKEVAGIKNLISTEKPFTVESADTGANIQSSASAADIAKLKQIADQAVARYNQDQKAADIAAKAAAKALVEFERVKATLEAKVAAGKTLQIKIRAMQDKLATHRQSLASAVSSKNMLTRKMRTSQLAVTTMLNQLTVAQVDAQKAKAAADKASLAVAKHRTDASNADKVATANEAAIEAAKNAAIDIAQSSNSVDKIVASKIVNNSIATLPIIFAIVASVAAFSFFVIYAVRRFRRRGQTPIAPLGAKDPEIDFDFDRILSDIRGKEAALASAATKSSAKRAPAKKAVVRKATPKKAAPKKR
jgi:hypothetical protein